MSTDFFFFFYYYYYDYDDDDYYGFMVSYAVWKLVFIRLPLKIKGLWSVPQSTAVELTLGQQSSSRGPGDWSRVLG